MSVSSTPVQSAPPPVQPTQVVVVEPKRGGWLAFKGFVATIILAAIFGAVAHQNKSTRAFGTFLAFACGAAYIIINLRQWKRNNDVVKGIGISWTIVTFLLLGCIGSLSNLISGGSGSVSSSPSSSGSETSASAAINGSTYTPPPVDPKEILLRDVKLDFNWRKDGFDNIMIANFTLKNPTQYRFKDFEIKCTHSAPSGTVIDSNSRTIYQTVEPKSTKVIREMNMGFIANQASRSGCQITDLVPLQ